MKTTLFFLSLSFFSLNLFGQKPAGPVLLSDMIQIRQLSNVSLSHDGNKAIFMVNNIVRDEKSKDEYVYRMQVYTASTKGAPNVKALTSGTAGASQPVFSPDDKNLAFVRSVNGVPQVFILSMDGGEAFQLTESKYGSTSPRWSPDGKQVLFASKVNFSEILKDSTINHGLKQPQWPLEKPGFDSKSVINNAKPNPDGNMQEARAYLNKNQADKKAKVFNQLNFQGESSTEPELSFTHYFITSVIPGSKPRPLTSGFYSYNNAEFSPDGTKLILASDIDSLQHPDRNNQADILSLDLGTLKLSTLASQTGFNFSSPKLSPSGRWLACLRTPERGINVPALILLDMKNVGVKPQIIPFDRAANNFAWSEDERNLYFTAPSNGGFPLFRLDLKDRKTIPLSTFDYGVESFDIAKNQLVYIKTEAANPFELYSSDLLNKNPRAISSFNSGWLKNKSLSMPEKKTFINDKGMQVEYWVMKPANFDAAKKYPLILQIHGGPAAMWGPGEASMWHEFQYFASQGFGVIYANPRGSGGYGQEFLRGNYQDWGKGPTSDVLTAMDGAISEGWVDTGKLAVTGGSYAGYLTAWIIAHDQRFAAASSQRGVYELSTFFGEGNAWRLVPNYFGGYPWEPKTDNILKRESPFTYVNQIKTPFLIFHGENDLRTGVIQSEMMYKALKVQQKRVEYVRHPGATHELTRSGNVRQRMDQMLRINEFFRRFIN